MDLYPSNIMWRLTDGGELDIKLIDWDAAHFVGEKFRSPMLTRLPTHVRFAGEAAPVIPTVAQTEFDMWFLAKFRSLSAADAAMLDGSKHLTKPQIDAAFKDVVRKT